jgi:hypothetical protein
MFKSTAPKNKPEAGFSGKKTAKTLEISLQTETLKNIKHVKVGMRK